jgi:methylated-DNA-[protein]-cysteine S-methyltransferase
MQRGPSHRGAGEQAGAPWQAKMATPFCVLGIRTGTGMLAAIEFLPRWHRELQAADAVAEQACDQIRRYIADPEFRFELRLRPCGTVFQRRVWHCIAEIAPGRTRSYGELAKQLGSSPRAVGQACGANPFPLVIPCHRVISRAGLGGFANHEAGYHLAIKRWLLDHERRP